MQLPALKCQWTARQLPKRWPTEHHVVLSLPVFGQSTTCPPAP
jgi:hypothetical protein